MCCCRPSFSSILSTLDHWAAGGHGWPVAAPSAAPLPSSNVGSSCTKAAEHSSNGDAASPTVQQPAEQQQRESCDAEYLPLQLKAENVCPASLEGVSTPQCRTAAGLRPLPGSPSSSQPQQQQQQSASGGPAAASAGIPAGPAGDGQASALVDKPRYKHMSWSEVEYGVH